MIRFDKEGETPLDDILGLKIKGISIRSELDAYKKIYAKIEQIQVGE